MAYKGKIVFQGESGAVNTLTFSGIDSVESMHELHGMIGHRIVSYDVREMPNRYSPWLCAEVLAIIVVAIAIAAIVPWKDLLP